MGIRLNLVFSPEPAASFLDMARELLPIAAAAEQAKLVVVHFDVGEYGGTRLLATNVTDAVNSLDLFHLVARILSSSGTPALHQWYSDSVGQAGYVVYERGSETLRADSPVAGADPLFPRFQEGFKQVFPAWAELGPEEVLDVVYALESSSASFVLSRDGKTLSAPEPYVEPPPPPYKRSLLGREFAWGHWPRKLLRGCLVAYGVLVAGAIVVAFVWWLIETFRP